MTGAASGQDGWHVHPDIAVAGTIDPRIHTDPGAHRRALDVVFARSWQWVPLVDDAPRVFPFKLLPDGLDEPLIMVRDGGAERVLSNVCTHRGALLAEEPSDAKGLRCRYHGRRFDLEGRMTSCPGFEGARDFPRGTEGLAELELRSLGPLRFTGLDPRLPFDDWAAPLAQTLAEYEGEALTFDPTGSRSFEIDASWALYCENYLEGFHVPFVHPALNAALDFSRYRTEILPHAVRQLGFASGEEPRLVRGGEPDLVADYLWLYPNLMVNAYAWGISLNLVEPIGVGRCRIRYLRWIARPEFTGMGAGGALDRVEQEDQEVVLSVQQGMGARLYPGGRFSPKLETGPHHFQRLLALDLSD